MPHPTLLTGRFVLLKSFPGIGLREAVDLRWQHGMAYNESRRSRPGGFQRTATGIRLGPP